MGDSRDRRATRLWARSGVAYLAVSLSACSSGGDEAVARGIPQECTALEPGEVATPDAEVQVLASNYALGVPAGRLARSLLPDGGDVYWYDSRGAVFVERQGNGVVLQLQPGRAPGRDRHEGALGLAANAEQLFAGFAWRPNQASDTGAELEIEPPGSLVAISKRDGQSQVLLTLRDHWLVPIVADAERVIVFAVGRDVDRNQEVGFYQVPLAAPRLEPLPLSRTITDPYDYRTVQAMTEPLSSGQLVRDELYWTNGNYQSPRLLRASFHDSDPEQVMRLPENGFYSIGPSYVLTLEDVWLPGYYYAGTDFVVRDDAGCRAVRGPRGSALLDAAVDESFAYWVGGASGTPAMPASVTESLELTRIDLRSGAVVRAQIQGFTPSRYLEIAGQDETRLFLYDGRALLAVRKP